METMIRRNRYRKEVAKQLMGNLPEFRVSMSIPFTHVGIDYALTIHMKCSKRRGQKIFKECIAVFVCMSTKAINLEAVSDLTTEAFLDFNLEEVKVNIYIRILEQILSELV